jgi:TolA protein
MSAIAARRDPRSDLSSRRLVTGLVLSLLAHALLLSLRFSVPDIGIGSVARLVVRLVPQPTEPAPVAVPVVATELPVPVLLPIVPSPQPGFKLVPLTPPAAPAAAAKPVPRAAAKHSAPWKKRQPERVLSERVITQEANKETDFAVPQAEPDKADADAAALREGTDEGAGTAVAKADTPTPLGDDQAALTQQRAAEALAAEQQAKERERQAAEDQRRADAERQRLAEAQAQSARELEEQRRARVAQELAQQQAAETAQQAEQQRQAELEARRVAEAEQRRRDAELLAERERQRVAELAAQRQAELAAERERQRAAELAAQHDAQIAAERERQRIAELTAEKERQRAAELSAQRLAEQRAAEEAARQRAAQQVAEAEAERQRAAIQAREQAERLAQAQRAEEDARRAAEAQVAAQSASDGNAQGRVVAAGSGLGGSGKAAGGGLGNDFGGRARDMLRGLDVLGTPPAAARPAQEDVAQRRRLVSASTERDVPLRMYVDSFRQKIERNGLLNGAQLGAGRVRIDPVVSVALRSDGSVEDVMIVRSSGHAEIDNAVRRIVRLNERYAAFPANVAARYDVIEIRRIWTFAEGLKLLEELR